MNKRAATPVSSFVRIPYFLGLLVLPWLACSCSTSKVVEQDRVLEPGEHAIGTLIDSDVLLEEGASLKVSYSAGNRFFVKSGAALSGFSKGGTQSTIYAEPGAIIPSLKKRTLIKIIAADDAEALFRDRFRKLVPAGSEGGSGLPATRRVFVGGAVGYGGYWNARRHYHYGHSPSRRNSSRSVSVKPDSYRKRD